jgi:hypothetical protein
MVMKHKYLLVSMALFFFLILFFFPSLTLIPGDFGSANNGPPDGVVDFEDLMIFALAYGSTEGDDNWNEVCDIYHDGIIDFEDLMIFAMHYGECECILPSVPTLDDPGDTLPSPASYTVSWSAVSGATSYVLQEATSSDFTSGLQGYPVTDTSKSFSYTVTTTTTYYYRVAAVNDCGQSGWSSLEDIIINCTLPSVPTLDDPGDTLPSPASYTVSWSLVSGATSYVLQEATSSDFTSGLQEYPLTDTSKSFSYTVTTTTTYYYRVVAVNSYGQSGWSNVEDITVVVTGPVHNLTKDTYYNTIQAALNDADSGDTIEVDDGTYNESIAFPTGKVVTLQSASGNRDNVIIQGANNLPTVTINGSSTGTTLSGFTITHTGGNTGRGINNGSGNLIIDNCIISGNTDTYGGGILINTGTFLGIISSTISDNTATHGGGISNFGTLGITSSTISGNTATYGGGIHNRGTLNITSSSTISSNNANDYGGGMFNQYGTLTITSSTISGNTANNYGGGIYNYYGTLTITSSTISSNFAAHGGGIHNYSGTLTITLSTTISGNNANYGGGIHNHSGTLTIISSTISGNTANSGGGISNFGNSTITGSTISYNTAVLGGGIRNEGGTSTILSITGSIISGNNVSQQGGGIYLTGTGINIIGGSSSSDIDNFNTFTDNKKDGIILADQHIRNSSGDCRPSYPHNYYNTTE